jgi:hypothetical protein
MRITVKTGIIAALCWIGLKLSFFYLGLFEDSITAGVLTNILGVLIAISVGLFLQKMRDTDETNALLDMKNAMSAGVPYVVLVSIFIYFFYAKINPEYDRHQISENEVAIEKMVNDPKQLDAFRKTHEDAEVMTKEEIEAKLKESNRQGAAPGFRATLSVLALLVLSTLYSILVTIIYRQVVFKQRPETLDTGS